MNVENLKFKRLTLAIVLVLLIGCSTTNNSSNTKIGDTRTKKVVMLHQDAFLIAETTTDKTYAFSQQNPVKVGGVKENEGPRNERRFLNALLGPNGEELIYFRAGSCCGFKTPNGIYGGGGMLDKYRVTWKGAKDTLDIYINMYDKGDLFIPVGLTAKR